MLFKPEHIELILSGRMTQISKLWEKPMTRVGSIHKAKTALFSKDYFASVIITDMRRERLGDITIEDAIKEGYDDLHCYIDAWIKNKGYWEPNTTVYVVSFELKESLILQTTTEAMECSNPVTGWDEEAARPDFAH
jgi:hypothetical protein